MLRIIISLTMPLPVASRVVLHLRRSWVCRQTGTGRSITSIGPKPAREFLTLSLFTLSNSALRQLIIWRWPRGTNGGASYEKPVSGRPGEQDFAAASLRGIRYRLLAIRVRVDLPAGLVAIFLCSTFRMSDGTSFRLLRM